MSVERARLPDPVTQGAGTTQSTAQVGQRLVVPAQDHREHVAAAHQAAGPDLCGRRRSATARSSSRSPVRVLPVQGQGAAERRPDVGEPVRVAAAPGQLAGRPELADGLDGAALRRAARCPWAWRATDSIHGSAEAEARSRARAAAWAGSAIASRSSSSASATSWLLGIGGPFPHQPRDH